ncbi:hypothetical protein NC651_012808 [Populus alba x Populus x berolinensis]|nr:hypothetical protein NC651_012808 [Populus alba x Populus x berolinensis]
MEEVKESENDEQLDDKYVNEFRFKEMCNDRATYLEKVANNGEDIIRAPKEMFDYHDLVYSRQGSRSAISFQLYRYEIDSDDQTPTKCGFKAPEQIRCLHESLQKLCFLEENQSHVLMRELGRLNQLRRLDIVKFRKRAGRALCSSIEMLINLRPLSVSAIRKGEVIDTHYLSSSPQFLQRIFLTGSLEKFTMPNLLISSILCLQLCKGNSFVLTGL